MRLAIPRGIGDIDDGWLRATLKIPGVECHSVVPLGAGHMADTHLMTLRGAPWRELVVKTVAADDGSRATARRHRAYEVEAGFYRDLAGTLDVRLPLCHWSDFDPDTGDYVVLLEHVAGAVPGDQIAACTADQAAGAVEELVRLHSPYWGESSMRGLPWLMRHGYEGYQEHTAERVRVALPGFLDRFADRLSPEIVELALQLANKVASYDRRGQSGPPTVGHGDFRADNLLFGQERVCVVDWQTAYLGNGLVDVSYFIGGSLSVADRRAHEADLVGEYHKKLQYRGAPLTRDDCWRDYRRHAFEGLVTAIISAPGKCNGNGDELFVVMTERAGWHALDLESASLLGSS